VSADGPSVVAAAGALVWRLHQGRLQVVLVHRPRYQDWSWPKGKLEPGESLPGTATREVSEETGYDVILGIPLPTLEYALVDGQVKRVSYWAAQVGGRPDAPALLARPPVPRASTAEIDRSGWFDVEVAATQLTNALDRTPLTALIEAHFKGRLVTHAIVVARHGRARPRSTWPGTELGRPLTAVGARQAAALVPVLSAFGVTDIVTSHWQRCRDTVEPYVRATAITPRESTHLSETEHESSPQRVRAEIDGLLAAGRGVVVCTHRPVLRTVLHVLAASARRSAAATLPAKDPYLKAGSVLVAHVARGEKGPGVVAAETHVPAVS
jgi:8-oxo-dGTP pyrophosphatase MutT (NUDIX family)/phosphohistidine phosphatase SixA